jgi:hypothetical protein
MAPAPRLRRLPLVIAKEIKGCLHFPESVCQPPVIGSSNARRAELAQICDPPKSSINCRLCERSGGGGSAG